MWMWPYPSACPCSPGPEQELPIKGSIGIGCMLSLWPKPGGYSFPPPLDGRSPIPFENIKKALYLLDFRKVENAPEIEEAYGLASFSHAEKPIAP